MITKIYRMLSHAGSVDDVNEVERVVIEAWFNGKLTGYQLYCLAYGIEDLKKQFKEGKR